MVVYLATPWLIRFLRKIDMVVKDQNKENTPLVPVSGGLAVMGGVFIGLMTFIFLRTFISTNEFTTITLKNGELTLLFASITTILMISVVGFIDDLIIKRSKEETSGLKQWQKPLLTLIAAVPLVVISAGTTTMGIPLLGKINLGLLYPLLIIPIGIVGASNMVNMLGGFNGLETGLGIISIGMLGLYSYFQGSHLAVLIALITVAALISFYLFNRYPAKILPGDSLTYLMGAVIAVIAIIGNMERAALIVSIPFMIEFILKARKRFKVDSFGYYKDGKVHSKYKKIYSIPHIFTRTGKFTEKQVVYSILLIELFFSSLIWLI